MISSNYMFDFKTRTSILWNTFELKKLILEKINDVRVANDPMHLYIQKALWSKDFGLFLFLKARYDTEKWKPYLFLFRAQNYILVKLLYVLLIYTIHGS